MSYLFPIRWLDSRSKWELCCDRLEWWLVRCIVWFCKTWYLLWILDKVYKRWEVFHPHPVLQWVGNSCKTCNIFVDLRKHVIICWSEKTCNIFVDLRKHVIYLLIWEKCCNFDRWNVETEMFYVCHTTGPQGSSFNMFSKCIVYKQLLCHEREHYCVLCFESLC